MSELTNLQKISALSNNLINQKMNDTDRFVHLSHIHELAEELQPQLNPNQKIFLDELKYEYCEDNPFQTLWHALEDKYFTEGSVESLSAPQQIEILQAFSQWATLKEERNER
ncbi:hypothetical protein C8162_RS11310 [Enterococcus faecalis]|nr:hypothetical protein [Enterococcus faecalis]